MHEKTVVTLRLTEYDARCAVNGERILNAATMSDWGEDPLQVVAKARCGVAECALSTAVEIAAYIKAGRPHTSLKPPLDVTPIECAALIK